MKSHLWIALTVMLFPSVAWAETPSPSQPLVTINPPLDAAIDALSSGSFKGRLTATHQVEAALAEIPRHLVSADKLPPQAQLETILRLNAGFSTWLAAQVSKPAEIRAASIQWGMQPEHILLVSQSYSTLVADRLDAAHKLAKMDDPQARILLAALLRDPNRDVHLAAMDILWDAPATTQCVDALWDRALGTALQRAFGPASTTLPPPLVVHGHPTRFMTFDSTAAINSLDGDIAMEMLIHLNSPLVADKLAVLVSHAASDPEQPMANMQSVPMWAALQRLLAAHANRQVVASLYQIAMTEPTAEVAALPPIGGAAFHWDRRIAALADLVVITGQDPDAYRLHKSTQQYTGLWIQGIPADEVFAQAKLKTWWDAHGAEFTDPKVAHEELPPVPQATPRAAAAVR